MTGSIYSWSTTAASNGNSDGDINFAEGQAPSTLNNSNRQAMARVAEYLGDNGGALVAGGTANALTVTANSAFTTYADGLILALRIATDNTTAATLNVNGIGAKSIRKMVGAGEVALSGAELQATGIYMLRYSAALNAAAGGWLLLNPTIDVPNLVTLTGSETLTNKSLTSPALTGTPTTPTAAPGTNTTQISSTAFVTAAVAALSTVYQGASAVLTALAGIGTAVAGDVIYASGAGTWARRAKGTALQALLMNSAATAPVWTTLPFSRSFESSQQVMTNGGALTLAHGMTVAPTLYAAFIVCTTADIGFSVGDETAINPGPDRENGSGLGINLVADATNVTVRIGQFGIAVNRKDTGAIAAITITSWKLIVRAWA
ncbi:hypothetical protein [Mesorhizobium sp. M7D.F.Ca.US.005.01.1.1]|uniref:hypothetical protein n=1 Tax=Mesorhizobium sp. M7D.F.Ca.US.005.01.1.1 TaxID=2493678 RepID=UPI0019CF95D3|nr:hypothetical protein [Mesorhizobium sp. M7D.F.Ca.US.005.01.1.1]